MAAAYVSSGCHAAAAHQTTAAADAVLAEERARGMETAAYYEGFQARAGAVKNGLLRFLLDAARDGHSVAAYGAAAKGNTLLNYAGVKPDLAALRLRRRPFQAGHADARQPYPDPAARSAGRAAAGLRAHPALEHR